MGTKRIKVEIALAGSNNYVNGEITLAKDTTIAEVKGKDELCCLFKDGNQFIINKPYKVIKQLISEL